MMEVSAARRRLFLLAALSLVFAVALVWAVVLRDWWLVVIGVIALSPMIGRLVDAFNLAWPGSRFGGWRNRLPQFRLSKAQEIFVGFAFLVVMSALLIIFSAELNAVAIAVAMLLCALWLFRLVRTA